MQLPLYRDEISGESHDFFRQIPVYQEQPTSQSGAWPHLVQPWPGTNNQNDGTQLDCDMAYISGTSNPRDGISNRSGQQQSIGRQNVIHPKGSNLQKGQPRLPTVIRSQPRNQPLDFDGLFAGSSDPYRTSKSFSVGKEQLEESSCAGQSFLYNHQLPPQSPEIVLQEQPSQNYDHFGGQIVQIANVPGCFAQQPAMDPNQVLYQQYIQEMHRQQQILQLQQHFQLSRQQQLQRFSAAQNQGFGTQILQDQNLLKVGAERLPFHSQPRSHLPYNLLGNAHWPLVNSSSIPGATVSESSMLNGNFKTDHPQKFPFEQNIQETCSELVGKNTNSYYEGRFQSSAESSYSDREQQSWSGISAHEEAAQIAFCPRLSITSSGLDQQEICEIVKSPEQATMQLFLNQSVGAHQHLQRSKFPEAPNKGGIKRENVWRGAVHMLPRSPVNNKTVDNAHSEVLGNWGKLHLQKNTLFQPENLHQPDADIEQRVCGDLRLQNTGSSLPENTLHLFTDFEFVEDRLTQEQSSLPTERSFLAVASSAERPHGDWKPHVLQQGRFHSRNSLQALLELDDDVDEDVSNQQVLQEALQIGAGFQSSDMEWQHEIHSWNQSMDCHELDNLVTSTSDQSMSRKPEGDPCNVIENTQLCSLLTSHNTNCFTSTSISKSNNKTLKDYTRTSQGRNGLLDELSKDEVSKEITGQLDGHVWEHGSFMDTNHEAFAVDVRKNKIMQPACNHGIVSNSWFVTQELDSELWASQQARSMKESGLQSWIIHPSTVINRTHVLDNGSIVSDMGQRSNEKSFAQPMLQGDKEKLKRVNYSLLENLQMNKFSATKLEPNAKLPSRLHSTNLTGSLECSIPTRSSLLSNNLISGWYNAEGSPTEEKKLNEAIPPQKEVQQLPPQNNGHLTFSGQQIHLASIPAINKELDYFTRIGRIPEKSCFGRLHGNDPNDSPSPSSSLHCDGSQHATDFSFYSPGSSIRNTLQLLNKHDLSEGVPLEVRPLLSTSALQTGSGSISHFMPLSESSQRQPVSPQHCGLQLGPPSHTNPSRTDGRSSFMFWHADNEEGCVGSETKRHGLLVSPQTRASEDEVELAKNNLSVEDSTPKFHSPSDVPPQSPVVNQSQNLGAPRSTFSIQVTSARDNHSLPQVSSENCVSSLNFTPESRLTDEKIFIDRVAVSSSILEPNPITSSANHLAAIQEVVIEKKKNVNISPPKTRLWNDVSSLPFVQKSYSQASFAAPLPRQMTKSQLSLEESSNQYTPKVHNQKDLESSISLDLKRNSFAQSTLVGHSSNGRRESNENMSSDLKDMVSTGKVAQVKALENATVSFSQGHSRVSAIQENSSSVYSHMHAFQSKLRATLISQIDNMIQKPLPIVQKVSTDSHKDTTANQQCGVGENLEKGRSQLGIGEGNILDSSKEHASLPASGEVPNCRQQVTPGVEIKNVTPSSRMPSFQRPLPGSNALSDQRLATEIHLHKMGDGRANSQLLSSSLSENLHESAQGYSQGSKQSKIVQPSDYSEKYKSSNLMEQQTQSFSNSFLAGRKEFAGQHAIRLQQSESVRHCLSSCTDKPNARGDVTVKTIEPTTHPQGSPSQVDSSLPMKRRKECLSLMPWHMAVNQSAEPLCRTSGAAEVQWAAAVNCLPEKGDEEVDLCDTSTRFAYRAKQRLRLTTQLMQTIIPPAPATLMQSTTVEGRDSGTFTISKVLLGEACSLLAGGGSTQSSGQQKLNVRTKFRAEAAAKDMAEFKKRSKRLEDCLSRLESLPSAVELKTQAQHLDKLCITNRLVDRHFDDFALEFDFLSRGRTSSALSQANCRVLPRRYVKAVAMPNRLPEENHLVSL